MLLQVILLVFLGCAIADDPSHDGWKQITQGLPVCVEPRDDGYGHLNYYGKSKLVAALKLKYESGVIRCTTNEAYDSRWGCASKRNTLNIIVTDDTDQVIFPQAEFSSGMWYSMPFVDHLYTDELVFTDFAHPFYLIEGERIRFWYGEDLTGYYETDNQGQVCFHVLARFI